MDRAGGPGADVAPWPVKTERGAVSGCRAVWDEFSPTYEACLPVVLRYTLARVGDPHVAEDLVGDTFERALRGWAAFHHRATARTWILGIARHVIADYWRRGAARSLSLEGLPDEVLIAAKPTAEERAQKNEDEQHLRRAIARLGQQDQDVLALRYGAELSLGEVAAVLGTREGAARVRLHRATQRLRVLLDGEEE